MSVGHYCSSSSIPASDAYLDGGVLQITPASTNPLFTDRGMWNTFRTCGRDDQQGGFAAGYLAKNFKRQEHRHHQRQDHLRQRSRRRGEEGAQRRGREGEAQRVLQQGDKDFTALVSKLKRNNIDIVYDGGYHQEAGLIVRQMRDQGLKTILMAGDALAAREFASITGPAGEGVLFTFGPDPRKRPTAAAIVKKFKDKGIDPEGYMLYTYAAFQVVGAGSRQGRHHRSAEGRRRHACRHLGHGARPASPSTRRATSPSAAGPSIAGTKTATTTRSQARRGGVRACFPGAAQHDQ